MTTAGRYRGNPLRLLHCLLFGLLLGAGLFLLGGCATTAAVTMTPLNIPLLQKWNGDYPVSELGRLPEGQRDTAAGYIGDSETFIRVWRVFMPQEILPPVDFSKNLVVFSRNILFYNHTFILKVSVQDGTAEITAVETMSATPVDDRVAMAMAVIPRHGVVAIGAGTEKIPVMN